jgi:nitrate/TMAO reductase-like tetraheme cytochrome c subunit
MRRKALSYLFISVGTIFLFVVGIFFLLPAKPVSAQCGSQASSCKNCHETQGQKPVNNDSTAWHEQHAFGDFCYLCHAGNNQAADEIAAHTGMVAPLSDINANCKSCHPNDFQAKAELYATTLGVTLGTATGISTGTGAATTFATPETEGTSTASQATECNTIGMPSDVIDYSQRYDEVVLGKKPVNTGNVILVVLLGGLVLGGGFLVLRKEGWLVVSFEDTKKGKGKYPADVTEMLPAISRLKPDVRKTLRRVLQKPQAAGKSLQSLEKQMEKTPSVKKK